MMEMPKPTAEHQRLAKLAGNWVGEETIFPSQWAPSGGKATARIQARMDLDGFYLIADYQHEKDGGVHLRGHGVYGWDARGRCYTLHWFDSSGIEHGAPSLGTWEGDTLTLQHEMKPFGHSRYVYQVGEGQYRMRLENSPDGKQWTPFLEGVYRRV
jgi:hypothetical protein